jgi:hypothetical protein
MKPSNKIDDLVKSPNFRFPVIPRKPESGSFKYLQLSRTPVSPGVTAFYGNIKSQNLQGNSFEGVWEFGLFSRHPAPRSMLLFL